jgi:hypothetical protein
MVQSRASSFKWEYPLLFLRSSSSFLCLLPRLLVTYISPFIFPSITFWYNDQKYDSVFTPRCNQMIFLVTYRASPQGHKVAFMSTACFCGRFICLRSNQNILQSVAVWFCYVVSYPSCSTVSSGSVHASQRTLSLMMVTVLNTQLFLLHQHVPHREQ